MNHTEFICWSEYVTMRDGIRLAVSTWLGNEYEKKTQDKRPAVVITTRYWRAMAFKQDNPEFQRYYPYGLLFVGTRLCACRCRCQRLRRILWYPRGRTCP